MGCCAIAPQWFETGSLLDVDVDDKADPDLAIEYGEPSNTNASVDLCIELGSGDMINIDEDTNIFLTIDIDPFLLIDSYVDHNSWIYIFLFNEILDFLVKWLIFPLGF
jgi:hypothetical protein